MAELLIRTREQLPVISEEMTEQGQLYSEDTIILLRK